MIFGLPWRLFAAIAGALLIIGAIYAFGERLYAQGVAAERTSWEQAQARIGARTAAAAQEIGRQVQQGQTRVSISLARGLETLQALPHETDIRGFLLVWRDADRGLCDAAAPSGGNHRT